MHWDIGYSFGEAHVSVATGERGVVFVSPPDAAFNGDNIIAAGDEAHAMRGRIPPGINIRVPISFGRVENERLVSMWIEHTMGRFLARIKRQTALISVPRLMPASDCKIFADCAHGQDAVECGYIDAEIASAIGAGIDITAPEGGMILDVGAGSATAAAFSRGRIIEIRALPYGSGRIDRDIIDILDARSFAVGPATAEDIKIQIGSAIPGRDIEAEISGIDLATGFPAETVVSSKLIQPAITRFVVTIAEIALAVLRSLPVGLSVDIGDSGIYLTGAGAMLNGLDAMLSELTGVPFTLAQNPESCEIDGVYRAMIDEKYSAVVSPVG